MCKKQAKSKKIEPINHENLNINLDINNPDSFLYQYWFTNNIIDADISINKDTSEHVVDISTLKEVIIDDTNNKKTK